MRLHAVRVTNYRSLAGTHHLELSRGLTCLVGPNNSGKSNLVGAVATALDPQGTIDPQRDLPQIKGRPRPRSTRIDLTFVSDARPDDAARATPDPAARKLLVLSQAYERQATENRSGTPIKPRQTYAARGLLVYSVLLTTRDKGAVVERHDYFGVPGLSRVLPTSRSSPYPGTDSAVHSRLLTSFRESVRFVSVKSGESLESVLEGPFREVLERVIQEDLKDAMTQANDARGSYESHLKSHLLGPLSARIGEVTGAMFPGVSSADLIPAIPELGETLSSLGVHLGDAITSDLRYKGTGVRAGVLVAILTYLAERSRSSIVFAVEEPEAFLHPAAQESLRSSLTALASGSRSTVLITTHSPFMLPDAPDGRMVGVSKDPTGGSRLHSDPRSNPAASLFRDAGMARVIADARSVQADGTRFVVVTEGLTDIQYMRIAAAKAERPDLLDGIQLLAADGAASLPALAVLTAQSTDRPVIALVDSDEMGRRAAKILKQFREQPNRRTVTVGALGRSGQPTPLEAEDLWPRRLVEDMNEALGGRGKAHLKAHAAEWLDEHATVEDCAAWVAALEQLNSAAAGVETATPVRATELR